MMDAQRERILREKAFADGRIMIEKLKEQLFNEAFNSGKKTFNGTMEFPPIVVNKILYYADVAKLMINAETSVDNSKNNSIESVVAECVAYLQHVEEYLKTNSPSCIIWDSPYLVYKETISDAEFNEPCEFCKLIFEIKYRAKLF